MNDFEVDFLGNSDLSSSPASCYDCSIVLLNWMLKGIQLEFKIYITIKRERTMYRMTRMFKGSLLLMLAALMLAACASKESMQAAELFSKSMEATAEIESFSVEMSMNQKMELEGETIDVDSQIQLDMILKPEMLAYQQITMNMMGQEMNMESYLDANGMYMQNPMDNSWMKVPAEMGGMIDEEQLNPVAQMEKLEGLIDDLELTTTDSYYELKLSASGEKMKEFILNELQNSGVDGELEAGAEALESLEINNLSITYTVDKETYFPLTTEMTMDVVMEELGQSVNVVMEMVGTYSNYNQVEPIEIPEEALQ